MGSQNTQNCWFGDPRPLQTGALSGDKVSINDMIQKKHSVINRPCNFLIFLFCFLFARPAAASMPMPAPVRESTAKIKVNVVDNFIINQSFKSNIITMTGIDIQAY